MMTEAVVADIVARKMAVLLGQLATLGKKPISLNTNLLTKPVFNVHPAILYDEADGRLIFSIPVTSAEVRYFEQHGIKTNRRLLRGMRDTALN